MEPAVLARTSRSGLEESVHRGHVVVCDAAGRIVGCAGNPRRVVYARSCMKPLQATVSLDASGERLPADELAVMCASHNGEDVHLAAVSSILNRAGLDFSHLRCPPAWPLDRLTPSTAGPPRRELHDCSGKHAGMLLASAHRKWDTESYRDSDHPVQERVYETVLRATDLERVHVGVDGCGVPVHGMELGRLAILYARLVRPDRLGALAPAASQCVAAMRAHPYMVAGRERLDTAAMEAVEGLVVKSGAEGLVCAAHLEAGLGIAIKTEDGAGRALGPALVTTLLGLDLIEQGHVSKLSAHARPPILGGGDPVGEVVPGFELERP